ncbi:MAG: class I SAM-dependent methyltransferase [Anaerolineales bacterium]
MSPKKDQPNLASEIIEHYESVDEAQRLEQPESQIERLRTQELLHRFLPPPPAVILDIGGGAGVYAFWLADRGYQVHLVDGVPRHISQAEEAAKKRGGPPLASINVGDARQIDHPESSADGVLLLGPLYHLTERSDRILALREARRVLRPGGVVIAAAINRFASMIAALQEDLITDPQFAPIYEQDMRFGQHRNPGGDPRFFTTAFFHYPQELTDEIREAGFRFETLLAVEGPARILKDFEEQWQKPAIKEKIMRITRLVEAEPTLWGVSAHIMAIGKKA